MKDKKVSSLLVVDRDGKPIGLVTERDLVEKGMYWFVVWSTGSLSKNERNNKACWM